MLAKLDAHARDLVLDLREDHRRLEALLEILRQDLANAATGRSQATWSRFEKLLARHLRGEEQRLLPLVLPAHPEEVRSIITEHRRMRELVSELGAQVELNTLHETSLLRLLRMLHVHARAEERGLYGWLTAEDRTGCG